MKKITTFAASLLAVACMSTSAAAAEQPLEKIAPFPKAEQGMKRQVIQLPQQQDKKEKQFVMAGLGDAGMLRYNSKLPIVVYTPANIDVKYRIWRADETIGVAVER